MHWLLERRLLAKRRHSTLNVNDLMSESDSSDTSDED